MPTIEHHHGAYILRGRGHGPEGTLIQVDWDYPGAAAELGWSLQRVQGNASKVRHLKRRSARGCDHSGTDGTIACPDCGVTASAFITAAAEFLSSRC
jgi:hypothetical protein